MGYAFHELCFEDEPGLAYLQIQQLIQIEGLVLGFVLLHLLQYLLDNYRRDEHLRRLVVRFGLDGWPRVVVALFLSDLLEHLVEFLNEDWLGGMVKAPSGICLVQHAEVHLLVYNQNSLEVHRRLVHILDAHVLPSSDQFVQREDPLLALSLLRLENAAKPFALFEVRLPQTHQSQVLVDQKWSVHIEVPGLVQSLS